MREYIAGNKIPAGSPVYLGPDGKIYPSPAAITDEDVRRLWADMSPDLAAERNAREWKLITGQSTEDGAKPTE